jgi:hypothetical protein
MDCLDFASVVVVPVGDSRHDFVHLLLQVLLVIGHRLFQLILVFGRLFALRQLESI